MLPRQLRVHPANTQNTDTTSVPETPPPTPKEEHVPPEKYPTVRTTAGELRGRTLQTPQGTTYFSFRGVPYAAPPVGELRFKAPRPAEPWSGVRDATAEGRSCIQPMVIPAMGPKSWSIQDVVAQIKAVPALVRTGYNFMFCSEDCLYANVYSPKLPSHTGKPSMPVVVYIHGGGFRLGDGGCAMYGPDYFMDAGGVVLVTFNYRLGPFGFLSVGTEAAPGNAGLKDQVMLLKWVRDNISAFGGDPRQVTLYGESAGGVSAHLHTLSPLSRGLFHRVICSSSLAPSDWAHEDDPLTHAHHLAIDLGVDDDDPNVLADRLRRVPARAMHRAFSKMNHLFTPRMTIGMYFVPVVEPPHDGAFLAEDPFKMLSEGRQAHVPVLTGHNSREGLLLHAGCGDGVMGYRNARLRRAMMAKCMEQSPEAFVPRDISLHLAHDPEARNALGRDILCMYFGADGMGRDKYDQFIDLFGDTMFTLPVLRMSKVQAETSQAPVYNYYLTHEGGVAPFKDVFGLNKYSGVSHADDFGYTFRQHIVGHCYRDWDFRDAQLQRTILALWTNFIKTGDPTPPEPAGSIKDLGFRWIPRTADKLQFLELDGSPRMREGCPYPRLKFWNDVYKRYLGVALF